MQTVIKTLPLAKREAGSEKCELPDEGSGMANLKRNVGTARSPIIVGLVIVAAAFCLGVAAGALITLGFFKII